MSGNNFNQHFASVGRDITDQLQREMLQSRFNTVFDEIYCANSLFLELTNEQEIGEIILELKRDSASGFDEISVKDLLNLKEILIPIITKLVNNILKSNIFPQELKISKISPIFKSGNRNCMNDYRPISVTSVFSKILEKIIKKRML